MTVSPIIRLEIALHWGKHNVKAKTPNKREFQDQQLALASFCTLILKTDDLDEILTEACRLVCEALKTDFAKVMELQPDGTLFLRAGVGWQPGVIGTTRLNCEKSSPESLAFAVEEPLISENVDVEDRFQYPAFMVQHAVKAFANIPIVGPDGKGPFGILAVDSRTPRHFSNNDTAFLRTYANLLAATVAWLLVIQRLKNAAKDKERLFVESQHRMKNHLMLISSFVRVRLRQVSSNEARDHLLNLSNRIDTIHLLHEKLYSGEENDSLDLGVYLSDLAGTLLSVQLGDSSIKLEIAVEHVPVNPKIAVPIGLIMNEFVTNSMKHAFDDGAGMIGVELLSASGLVTLRIWDDGKGIPEKRDSCGTGLNLINALAGQINAEAAWSSERGTTFVLTFRP